MENGWIVVSKTKYDDWIPFAFITYGFLREAEELAKVAVQMYSDYYTEAKVIMVSDGAWL